MTDTVVSGINEKKIPLTKKQIKFSKYAVTKWVRSGSGRSHSWIRNKSFLNHNACTVICMDNILVNPQPCLVKVSNEDVHPNPTEG